MLYLIGTGLEEGDMTLKGQEALKICDEFYVEAYTSFPYEIKGAKKLSRLDVESKKLIELAKTKTIALLVGGDPLFATTHLSLIQDCESEKVEFEIIHAPSIINAVLRTGLSPYKFGRIITISKNFESDKKRINSNLESDLHTLCLIDPELTGTDALKVLVEMNFNQKMVMCERLGTKTQKIYYGLISDLQKIKLGNLPHSIIIPSSLHFFEEEILSKFELHK